MKKIMVGLVAGLALSTMATAASADPPRTGRDYEYVFGDEKLLGDTMGSTAAQITVLRVGRRERLLRPRVQFIQEMLKSVENM